MFADQHRVAFWGRTKCWSANIMLQFAPHKVLVDQHFFRHFSKKRGFIGRSASLNLGTVLHRHLTFVKLREADRHTITTLFQLLASVLHGSR